MRHRAWWVHEPLDEQAMQQAANHLQGEHDFSAFRAAACRASTPVRNLSRLQVSRSGELIALSVTGNAFLQHMVRNITGTLVAVGKGDADPDWVRIVLDSRDRTRAGVAAPPHGLTLVDVEYPERFSIPRMTGPAARPQSDRIRL